MKIQHLQLLMAIVLMLLLGACDPEVEENIEPEQIGPAPIILISMDGFRWDYMDRTDTPNMDYIANEGVRAESMIPVFPSFTFPNHLSIITGCYPQNHGITNNTMWDSVFEEWYFIGEGAEPVQDGKWYEAEPFWVTVEKAGLISAIYHWPGSEAEIMGYRPSHYNVYDGSITNEEKIDQVLNWLDLSEADRPSFMAIYFSDANYWGHLLGTQGTALDTVIQGLDEDVGRLLSGLEQRGLEGAVNIIIVADHGMTDLSEDRVVFLDDYISPSNLEWRTYGPVAMILPPEDEIDSIFTALEGVHPNFSVYLKDDTPEHLHYRDHRRITPIVGILDAGWQLTTHSYFNNYGIGTRLATHGYDPLVSSMQAIFLASGPHFKEGITVPKFQNIHVYDLMASILDLDPAINDGSLDSVRVMLSTE